MNSPDKWSVRLNELAHGLRGDHRWSQALVAATSRLIDGPATRVDAGINASGTGKCEELDEEYREWAYEKPGYCSWLDESSERRVMADLEAIGTAPLQTMSAPSVPGDVRRELGRLAEGYSVLERLCRSELVAELNSHGVRRTWRDPGSRRLLSTSRLEPD